MKSSLQIVATLGLLAAGAAYGQSTATTTNPPGNTTSTPAEASAPAAVASSDNPRTSAAPVAGANSFTEGQARARMEEKGFGTVKDLKKDDNGVWRATAIKDGKSMTVALDYQGNVVSN